MPANGTSLAGVAVPFRISLSSYPSSRQRSDHDAVRKLDVFVVMYKTQPKVGPCFTQQRHRSAGANAKMGHRLPCLGAEQCLNCGPADGRPRRSRRCVAGLDVCSERWHAPAEGPGAALVLVWD